MTRKPLDNGIPVWYFYFTAQGKRRRRDYDKGSDMSYATVRMALGDAGTVVYNALVDVWAAKADAVARVDAARTLDADSVTRSAALDNAERQVRRLTRAAEALAEAYETLADACKVADGVTVPTPTPPATPPATPDAATPNPTATCWPVYIGGDNGVMLNDLQYIAGQVHAIGATATVFALVERQADGVYTATTFYGDPASAGKLRRANEPSLMIMLATGRFKSEAAARRRAAQNEATWFRAIGDLSPVLSR